MRRSVFFLFLTAALTVLSSCTQSTEPLSLCTDEWVYGLHVEVRDTENGDPAAIGSLVIAREGPFTDTLRIADRLLALGAGERGGTYSLVITKPGYQAWHAQNIHVTRGQCHVTPVVVHAALQPL